MNLETIEKPQSPNEIMVVTTNDLAGCETIKVFGECWGLTVRSRHVVSNWLADLKSIFGGELRGITKLLHDCRQEALERLREDAFKRGANAILMFRFETTDFSKTGIEVCAYGTAVLVRKINASHQIAQ